MHFGTLRVINDDTVMPERGFDTHAHMNMEIITIPLAGAVQHKDSRGNQSIVHAGEIQLMSAGSGIERSEFNPSTTELLNLLQIWVIPNKRNTEPTYQQKNYLQEMRENELLTIVSPAESNLPGLKILQDAYFTRASVTRDVSRNYPLFNTKNGVYLFVIDGEIAIKEATLGRRDAAGIVAQESFEFRCLEDASLLFIEVPMLSLLRAVRGPKK